MVKCLILKQDFLWRCKAKALSWNTLCPVPARPPPAQQRLECLNGITQSAEWMGNSLHAALHSWAEVPTVAPEGLPGYLPLGQKKQRPPRAQVISRAHLHFPSEEALHSWLQLTTRRLPLTSDECPCHSTGLLCQWTLGTTQPYVLSPRGPDHRHSRPHLYNISPTSQGQNPYWSAWVLNAVHRFTPAYGSCLGGGRRKYRKRKQQSSPSRAKYSSSWPVVNWGNKADTSSPNQ